MPNNLYQMFDESNFWLKYRNKRLLITGDPRENDHAVSNLTKEVGLMRVCTTPLTGRSCAMRSGEMDVTTDSAKRLRTYRGQPCRGSHWSGGYALRYVTSAIELLVGTQKAVDEMQMSYDIWQRFQKEAAQDRGFEVDA